MKEEYSKESVIKEFFDGVIKSITAVKKWF